MFFLTVGASSKPRALRALRDQNYPHTKTVINNVAPMSAAFQAMLDRCETQYFVQLDEDMVLRPGALQKLHLSILGQTQQSQGKVSHVVHPLWDQHLDRAIVGIKAYNHHVVKDYPYRDIQSCEMDQVRRMKAAGFRMVSFWKDENGTPLEYMREDNAAILGDHGTIYSPREAFERYRDLAQKYRLVGGNNWFAPWMERFLRRFAPDVRIDNPELWAFQGAATGMVTESSTGGEKDYREYTRMADFGELVAHVTGGPQRLDVHSTPICNLKCEFCRRQQGGGQDEYHFMPTHAEKVLAAFPSLTSACIAGFGDPLCAPQIEQTIQLFLNRGMYVSMITNGVAVVQRFAAIPWLKLGYVNVSMNEVTADAHAKMSGVPGAFQQIVAGIDMLVAGGANVVLSFVVDANNHDRIPAYLKFAADHGIKTVSIVNILPHHDVTDAGQNKRFWARVIHRDSAHYLKALPGYRELARKLGVAVNAWPTPISRTDNPRHCRSPYIAIGVGGSGFYTGCCRVEAPHSQYGGLSGGLRDWQANPELVELRRQLSGKGELRPACTMCFGNWQRG